MVYFKIFQIKLNCHRNLKITFFEFKMFLLCFVLIGRFPFDWHNPIGYIVAVVLQSTWGMYTLCVILYQTSFFIGSCWMLVSLAEDITCELQTVNQIDGNPTEFTEKFMNFIQLYSDSKQLREIRFFLLWNC